MYKIITANWRDDSTGPIQVVSGALGKERVHFQAPAATRVAAEMEQFLDWFNRELEVDSVLKAGIAHFWFLTIHPFEDGNGRIARAIADLCLSRAEKKPQRFYSMSAQINIEKKQYYALLEKCQKGSLDLTAWLEWFISCLGKALQASEEQLNEVMAKFRFWNKHQLVSLNERQIKVINLLFGDFFGKLSTSKWAKINKCSKDTALRDIQDLMQKGILAKQQGGGRSTAYELIL